MRLSCSYCGGAVEENQIHDCPIKGRIVNGEPYIPGHAPDEDCKDKSCDCHQFDHAPDEVALISDHEIPEYSDEEIGNMVELAEMSGCNTPHDKLRWLSTVGVKQKQIDRLIEENKALTERLETAKGLIEESKIAVDSLMGYIANFAGREEDGNDGYGQATDLFNKLAAFLKGGGE